jgi:CelD/BcsL family acetyltransferase involved in cellulose biosynthesis
MSSDFYISRTTFGALSAQDISAWRTLMEASPQGHRAFMSPDFCAAAEAAFERPVTVVIVRRPGDGRLVGVLPLQSRGSLAGALGVYEPVAGVMNDCFGLLGMPDLRVSPAQLLSASNIGCVHFSHLDEEQAVHGLNGEEPRIGLRTRIRSGSDSNWDELRGLDKKLVSDTERRERKLEADVGPLQFTFQVRQRHELLDQLIALKSDQYRRTHQDAAPLFEPANTRLLHLLVDLKAPECTGVLSSLHAGGRLLALHFGLQSGGTLHFWFPVYDQHYAAYSPGRILFRHVMRDAPDHGVELIDRGEGDSKAKRDFANEEHMLYKGVWAHGARGLVAKAALSATWRWQRRVRPSA